MWQFKTDPESVGENKKWYNNIPVKTNNMFVSSCWNMSFSLLEYRGKAWYKTKFTENLDNLILEFEAVACFAKVWLDGGYLGEHYGGFTAFLFEINRLNHKSHILTVMAYNFSEDGTIPNAIAD